MRPVKFNLILAFVLIGLSSVATAQSPTDLDFYVNGGEGGLFPILANGSGNALDYAIPNGSGSGSVNFMIDPGVSYDNPFFCFDFSDTVGAVALNGTDAGGQVVMNSVGLASNLSYKLPGTNLPDTITFSPSSSVQCFYTSTQTIDGEQAEVFGPFGKQPTATRTSVSGGDGNSLFGDSFAVYPEVALSYENFNVVVNGELVSLDGDLSVVAGDELVYEIVLHNAGKGEANSIALQEVFPSNGAFDAGLTEGGWICEDNWDNLLCPQDATGALRFQDISLPAGGKLTFTISRIVQTESTGQINLFAGAVNGPGSKAESAVAKATLDVLGEPVQLEFVQQPTETTVGQVIDPPVVVEVVDSNGNRVTTDNSTLVALELHQDGGLVDLLVSGTAVTNGVASFDSLDTSIFSAGTGYQIKAIHGISTPTIGSRLSNQFDLISP